MSVSAPEVSLLDTSLLAEGSESKDELLDDDLASETQAELEE